MRGETISASSSSSTRPSQCSLFPAVTKDDLFRVGTLKELSRASMPSKIQKFPLPKESQRGEAGASQPGMAKSSQSLARKSQPALSPRVRSEQTDIHRRCEILLGANTKIVILGSFTNIRQREINKEGSHGWVHGAGNEVAAPGWDWAPSSLWSHLLLGAGEARPCCSSSSALSKEISSCEQKTPPWAGPGSVPSQGIHGKERRR